MWDACAGCALWSAGRDGEVGKAERIARGGSAPLGPTVIVSTAVAVFTQTDFTLANAL